ncbi:MAG: hypothetical protein QGH94_14440 [Phycisphaerae bacterium]|nr:hypothetical protein [Phycisphaerae bacterium]MDP7289181.1 hypothetical protein [Phycisphaerae bacterium]
MSRRAIVLLVVTALMLPIIASSGPATAAVDPIRAIKGAIPKPSIFQAASRNTPLVVRSEKEASAHFPDVALAALKKQVDFKQQTVLVFAWRGSGQDRMTYTVAESFPEQVFFKYRPGRTCDLRVHMKIFALRSNVRWRGPNGKTFGGGKAATAPVDKQLAAAKKHPRYNAIYAAKNVVVAKLVQAKLEGVAESYPAVFEFKLTLQTEQVLRGQLKPKARVRCNYSQTAKKMPSMPIGKLCLVLLSIDRSRSHAYYLAQASEELLAVARIAAAEANKADEAAAATASEKPEKHPLYAKLKKADGVVVATGDMEGTSSHDNRSVTTESEICVVSMKGKLKSGGRFEAVFPASVAPNGKLPDAEFVVIGYKLVGGKYQVTCVAEASDTNLRVAAAATDTKRRTLKQIRAIKLRGAKRTKPSRRGGQSTEPQSGQSTPSRGTETP